MSSEALEEGEEFWIPLGIPAEFPYEFGPDSPAESVLGSSTETESDEDELTQLLTRSTLQETPPLPTSYLKTESDRVMASSPKSTLSRPKTWPCQAPFKSAATGPICKDQGGWDVLFTPAGVKMSREGPLQPVYPCSRGLLHPQNANQVHLLPPKAPSSGFSPQHCGQMVNYQAKLNSRWISEEKRQIRGRYERPLGLMPQSTWPNLHPEDNSNLNRTGMKPVFLSGMKRERSGTGVFLPRRYDSNNSNSIAANPRKKPSCSTVLMPAKVIQSLNLNFEDIAVHPSQSFYYNYNVGFAPNYDAFMARRNVILAQQKRRLRVEGMNHEVHLPQEWTY